MQGFGAEERGLYRRCLLEDFDTIIVATLNSTLSWGCEKSITPGT